MTVYLAYADCGWYSDAPELVGIYSTREKAEEASFEKEYTDIGPLGFSWKVKEMEVQ